MARWVGHKLLKDKARITAQASVPPTGLYHLIQVSLNSQSSFPISDFLFFFKPSKVLNLFLQQFLL